MPTSFTPAPREDVLDVALEMSSVYDATHVGGGIRVVYHAHESESKIFTDLVENFGWYVAEYYPQENGDRAVLMPITGVDV